MRAVVRLLAAALVLATAVHFSQATFAASDPDIGFVAVGGESGLGLSEVLANLIKTGVLSLRPEVVKASQAPIAAVRASYALQDWVDLSDLMNYLCEYNKGVCTRTRGEPVWRVQVANKAQLPPAACDGPRHPGRAADLLLYSGRPA